MTNTGGPQGLFAEIFLDSQSNTPARRLLIFGCGYVGSAVAAAARARGWRVVALTRSAERAAALRESGVEVIEAALESDAWHRAISREQDCVVNCVSSGGGGLAGYRRSYVEGTQSILAWAAPGVPATYVYTSSTSVYPQGEGEIVTEDSRVGGGSEAATPLLEAEQLVRDAKCFSRWFILRLAGIYGPGRHFLLDQLRAGATEFPGTGAHRLNLIHRDDIVAAVFACLLARSEVRDTIFNVAGDVAARKDEVAAWLAAQIGRDRPTFVRDAPAASRDHGATVRGRSGPAPDRLISNARLKQALGWRPQFPEFRDGYRAILKPG